MSETTDQKKGLLDWLTGPPKEVTSKEEVKKRLQMTVFHDRMEIMDLPTDKLDELRSELLAVISKYFEIDTSTTECSLEHDEQEVAFVATIPVKRLR